MDSISSGDTVIRAWQHKAQDGDFDEDLHIVDPQAHFDRLDRFEDLIISNSEFYHCKGSYDLLNDRVPPSNTQNVLTDVAPWMWTSLQDITQSLMLPPANDFEAEWQDARKTLASLWKSYLMLCQVLNNFSILENAGFSKDFFSFLLRRSADTAEIVKICPSLRLNNIKLCLENACRHVLENIGVADSQQYLTYLVEEPCLGLLDDLGFNLPEVTRPNTSILAILRTAMLLLDLALVSYVGSHGSRFNDKYMAINSQQINVVGTSGDEFSFRCYLQRMACLDGFLDSRLVWVFELHSGASTDVRAEQQSGKGMLLLTTMDAFGDLWGPVWSIPMNDGNSIKQYNVSKGVIYPISGKRSARADGAVPCHWHSWASFYRLRMSNLFKRHEELGLATDDLLLIGGEFRHNGECDYTLDKFEEDFENQIDVIGTTPETWRLENRSLGLSFSKMLGVAVTGTQKKIPQTTLKQHILDKWSNKPERANPGVLNMYLGLEISHCTGNARRVPLKALLLMDTIVPLLERQQPAWAHTSWGMAFLRALANRNPEAIFDVWKQYTSNRKEMADLVCSVLEVLDTTGYSNDRFTAGFFHNGMESAVTLDHNTDDWTVLLKDSHLMAVFPVVNEICLEFHTPNHSTATCNSKNPTVLQTQIAVVKKSKYEPISNYECIKLKPYGQTLRKRDVGSIHINLFSLETAFGRVISSVRNLWSSTVAAGAERRDQSRSDYGSVQFYIRGSAINKRRIEVLLQKGERSAVRSQAFTTNVENKIGDQLFQPSAKVPMPVQNQAILVNKTGTEIQQTIPITAEPNHRRIMEDIEEYYIYDEEIDDDVLLAMTDTGVGTGQETPLQSNQHPMQGTAPQATTATSPRLRRQPNFEWHGVRDPPI